MAKKKTRDCCMCPFEIRDCDFCDTMTNEVRYQIMCNPKAAGDIRRNVKLQKASENAIKSFNTFLEVVESLHTSDSGLPTSNTIKSRI